MSASSGSFLSILLELLARLFGGSQQPPAPPAPPETGKLVPLSPRVLMITYNPIVDSATGKKLIETVGWNDPNQLVADFIADVDECSGGLVKYQVVERIEVNAFPVLSDGFRYDANTYLNLVNGHIPPHEPSQADYHQIVADFNLLTRVGNAELDEVWLFAFPYAGFYESTMAGRGAFWCNSEPRPGTDACPRKFVIMGFSPERGVGEMHEDLGHRAEAILGRVFHSDAFVQWTYNSERTPATVATVRNDFERFLLFDQIAPGMANLGTVHYAPNSTMDYEWGRDAPVPCCADDWLEYPNLPNPPNYKMMTANDWGNGDIRGHHKWWMKHFPKAAGVTNGIANNWWKYIIDPNNVQ